MVFLLAVLGYLVTAFWNASLIPDAQAADRVFPMFVGGVSIVATSLVLVQMIRRSESDTIFADKETSGEDAEAPHGLWGTLAWFAGLLLLTTLVGFIIALAAFLIVFFRFRAGEGWIRALVLSGLGIAFMCFMAWVLNRDLPPAISCRGAYIRQWQSPALSASPPAP